MKIKVIVFLLLAHVVLFSQTKIEWLNSAPGGALINCFSALDDSTYYAAGTNSILAKSDDAGKTWIIDSQLKNNIAEFRKMKFFDKNNGVILGDVKPLEASKIYYTKDGGINWIEAQFPFNVHINDWLFLNEQYGIALGPYELYKTVDGGKSWAKEMLEVGYKLDAIIKNGDGSLCISSDRVISWGNKFTSKNIAGAVIISKDNGTTWEKFKEYNDKIVAGSYFIDGQTGIICCYDGDYNYIYKTINGGKTFEEKMVLHSEKIQDLYFPIKDIGMLMLGKGIIFSDNQGETWNIKYTDGTSLSSFYNYKDAIYTVGGAIKVSNDNGYTWNNITPRFNNFKSKLQVIDKKNLVSQYRVENANAFSIMKTTDGGVNWKDVWNYSTKEFQLVSYPWSVAFFTPEVGFLTTNNHEILRTDDGGNTWNRQTFFTDTYLGRIKIYNEKIILIIASVNRPNNQNGAIIYTTNGGNSWNQSGISDAELFDVDFADKNTWFVVGAAGVFKSTDTGKSWSVNYKIEKPYLLSVSFATKDTGYAVGTKSNLVKTVNGGKSWSPVDFNLGSDVYYRDVKFWGKHGVIVSSNGLFITTDRGESWRQEEMGNAGIIDMSISLFQNICYLSGYSTTLRFSSEGNFPFGKTIESELLDNKDTTKLRLIKEISLSQNYPNPFNPSTTISYQVSAFSHVSLKVYDLLGREVATLVDELKQPGTYNSTFSIINYPLPSGVYFYRMQAGSFTETKKLVLLK